MTKARSIEQKLASQSRVEVRVPELGPCVVWTGYRSKRGYGYVGVGRSNTQSVARTAWELAYHREIPDNEYVVHKCGDRACFAIEHMTLAKMTDVRAGAGAGAGVRAGAQCLSLVQQNDGEAMKRTIDERLERHSHEEPSFFNDIPCRVWHGSRNKRGQGRISVGPDNKGLALVERLVWRRAYGDESLDHGSRILHLCGDMSCFEMSHMQVLQSKARLQEQQNQRLGQIIRAFLGYSDSGSGSGSDSDSEEDYEPCQAP